MKMNMKPLAILAAVILAALAGGCATGIRTQGDEAIQSNEGVRARGPRLNIGNVLGLSLLSIDTKVKTAVEEPAITAGSSALSKSGLKDFAANVKSARGAGDLGKSIEYGIAEIGTEAQADAIKAFFSGLGEAAAAWLTSGATPAIKAIAGNAALSDAEKKAAIKALLPPDAPDAVRRDLSTP